MDETFRILILQEIERIWKTFKSEMKPNGIWVAEHKSVPLDFDNIMLKETPKHVYFLDKTGILETEIAEYQKFTNFTESPIQNKNDFTFEVGLAMFAEYEASKNFFYFCYQFGKRFGKGYQVKFNDAGEFIKYKNIWVS